MFPQIGHPCLCTYYAFTALLVVFLTIRLMWVPSVQMVAEVSTVFTRAVIYFNAEVLGYSNHDFFASIEAAFLSEKTLLSITLLFTSFILYLASSDIMNYASSYFACLTASETLNKVQKFFAHVIDDLINATGNKKPSEHKSETDGRESSH